MDSKDGQHRVSEAPARPAGLAHTRDRENVTSGFREYQPRGRVRGRGLVRGLEQPHRPAAREAWEVGQSEVPARRPRAGQPAGAGGYRADDRVADLAHGRAVLGPRVRQPRAVPHYPHRGKQTYWNDL